MMDEQLVMRSHPESGGRWLNVWMGISDEWCPSGFRAGTGALQHLTSDTDTGIECTLSSLQMAAGCAPLGTPEGWDAIQRDPDRLSSAPRGTA